MSNKLKYTFAYDRDKKVTPIEKAVKGVNYYLTEDLQCELRVRRAKRVLQRSL